MEGNECIMFPFVMPTAQCPDPAKRENGHVTADLSIGIAYLICDPGFQLKGEHAAWCLQRGSRFAWDVLGYCVEKANTGKRLFRSSFCVHTTVDTAYFRVAWI